MKSKRILCVGGAGSIGSELVRQLSHENTVYVLDINETDMFDLVEELNIQGRVGDIRDETMLEEVFYDFVPDLIFHCAALKHVTPNEHVPIEAVRTNILGTYNVIKMAKRFNARLVNISTDKVVNGESIMGLTKKIAEKMVKQAGYVSVRFGNVLGSRGSVIPIWQKELNENKPLTVTDERMTRYMMTITEAVKLVIKAAEIGKPGQILIMDMKEKVNVLQLAKDILGKSGKDVGIKMIGMRLGETLSEELMNETEKATAIKEGNYWVLT